MLPATRSPRIDAHQHLWRYSAEEYGWIDDSMQLLRRNFLLDDLREAMQSAQADGAVAVQARQTVEETRWLLSLAAGASPIRGVVGWLPIAEDGFAGRYEALLHAPKLKGLRHIVQAEPAGFLDGDTFNAGIRTLRGTGLVYDILILPPQMDEAIRFIDRHPEQTFVLDHMAKPLVRAGVTEPWTTQMRAMAQRPNVTCKVSGLVTEADPARWTAAQLQPYLDVALEAFGARRLMIGTDWPVLTQGCTYAQWWAVVEAWAATLTADEQAALLGETATRVYQLDAAPREAE